MLPFRNKNKSFNKFNYAKWRKKRDAENAAIANSAVANFKKGLNLPFSPIRTSRRPPTPEERNKYIAYRNVAATADANWKLDNSPSRKPRPTTEEESESYFDYNYAVSLADDMADNKKKPPIPNFAAASKALDTTEEDNEPEEEDTTYFRVNLDTVPGAPSVQDLDTYWKKNQEAAFRHKARSDSVILGMRRPLQPKFKNVSIDFYAIAKRLGYSAAYVRSVDLCGYTDTTEVDAEEKPTYMLPDMFQYFKPDDIVSGKAVMIKKVLADSFHPQQNRLNHLLLCASYDPPLNPAEQKLRFKFHVSSAYDNGTAPWQDEIALADIQEQPDDSSEEKISEQDSSANTSVKEREEIDLTHLVDTPEKTDSKMPARTDFPVPDGVTKSTNLEDEEDRKLPAKATPDENTEPSQTDEEWEKGFFDDTSSQKKRKREFDEEQAKFEKEMEKEDGPDAVVYHPTTDTAVAVVPKAPDVVQVPKKPKLKVTKYKDNMFSRAKMFPSFGRSVHSPSSLTSNSETETEDGEEEDDSKQAIANLQRDSGKKKELGKHNKHRAKEERKKEMENTALEAMIRLRTEKVPVGGYDPTPPRATNTLTPLSLNYDRCFDVDSGESGEVDPATHYHPENTTVFTPDENDGSCETEVHESD